MNNVPDNQSNAAWHVVEERIWSEVLWLESHLDTFLKEESHTPEGCKYCYLRKIALLIVCGDVEATEIKQDFPGKSFWLLHTSLPDVRVYHGGDWHRSTMECIEHHFSTQDYTVIREPPLQRGRADLGVFKSNEPDLYVEIGTVSFYKLMTNLMVMRHFIYLLVPCEGVLLEFRKK